MTVRIITNTDEYCGNAEYARDLAFHLKFHCPVGLSSDYRYGLSPEVDVVLVNWHPARVGLTREVVEQLKSKGKKVIVIWQNSFDGPGTAPGAVRRADAVVAHEPMQLDVPVEVIPHGILEFDFNGSQEVRWMVGTAGFQFPWKRTDVAVKAARRLGGKSLVICPPYPGYNWGDIAAKTWDGHDATTLFNWSAAGEVVINLASCLMTIFWFEAKDEHDQLGQTGSARLGVAAKRPMIISRHRKFRTLLPYEDEFYIADTEEQVYQFASQIKDDLVAGRPVKRPKRVLEEQGWSVVAKKYWELIERVSV